MDYESPPPPPLRPRAKRAELDAGDEQEPIGDSIANPKASSNNKLKHIVTIVVAW